VTTAVVAAATAACGLFMLSGAGPAPASADDVTVPVAPAVAASSTEPDLTEPATSQPALTEPSTEPPSTELMVLAALQESTTTTTTTAPPAPIPLSVAPQSITVGVGGAARISGECPVVDGSPLGPVVIWEIGATVTPISTGVTAAKWSYDWTAPNDVEPLVLQIWCGDPSQYVGGYPESLQIDVVFVDQVAPTTTTTTTVANEPAHVIPETG